MSGSLWVFLTGSVGFWALASGLAFLFSGGQREFVMPYSSTAAGLCLVPATVTLVWVLWGLRQSPDLQRLAILAGTGIRMFVTLGAALVLTTFNPYFQQRSFWLWILVFYLFTLALEIIVVLRHLALSGGESK